MNSQDDDDMLRQMRTLDRTKYYALFITVPLTLY